MLSYIQHLIGDIDVSTEDIDQDTETISHDSVISDIKVYTDLLAACRLCASASVSGVKCLFVLRGTGLWKGGFDLSMIFFTNTTVLFSYFLNNVLV